MRLQYDAHNSEYTQTRSICYLNYAAVKRTTEELKWENEIDYCVKLM